MATNRTPIERARRPSFDAATLALFAKLEHTRERNSRAFKAAERDLAERLGLIDEWWTVNSVLNRSSGPCHPPGYIAHRDFFTCRRMRQALLDAVRERKQQARASAAASAD
jgi:hypothetical protein